MVPGHIASSAIATGFRVNRKFLPLEGKFGLVWGLSMTIALTAINKYFATILDARQALS